MTIRIEAFIQILQIFFLLLPSSNCQLPLDALTPNDPIRDGGDVLVSSRKRFALGFFSPGNSQYRYVGIWLNNIPNQTIVWVANRDNPINDSSGVLSINGDGGLVIHGNDQSTPLWSAKVVLSSPNNSIAKLLDTGNLVLLESESSQRAVWESFDYPSNTMLSSWKMGFNRQSGLDRFLTSWKSRDDPGTGNFTFRTDRRGFPQLFVYKSGAPIWRGGPWMGLRWSGLPDVTATKVGNVSFVNNEDEISSMYVVANDSFIITSVMIDESGILKRLLWNEKKSQWINLISYPNELCDKYGQCGPNGNCNPYKDYSFACTCLPGFEPKSPNDWYLRVGVDGCIRKTEAPPACQNGEGFVKVEHVKVPDSSAVRVNMSLSLKDCKLKCLMDCSCTAFSSADERRGGIGCLTWHGDLIDTRTYSNVGHNLYVRVDATSLENEELAVQASADAMAARYDKKSKRFLAKKGMLILALPTIAMIFIIFSALWCSRRKTKRSPRQKKHDESEIPLTWHDGEMNQDLAIFDLNSIVVATDNFSTGNKLGEGGFGSVYKGLLVNGQEVAVKRLSMNSGQGFEEFKNEVKLIANLQHRNLVRLYGCCISSEEKMLIYEYLPNKSLDFFIFDKFMSWKERFNIINGIARGILYLHQDSRLKIVHRDIKASNVLLDSAMNPKISDFGLAKMFGEDQIQENTKRVVGTYGYMSPEYAMQGRYSTKSDVFSFGVLLLEIISGKRNTDYDPESADTNLIGRIWDMWREGRALEIVDPSLNQSYPAADEVSRCIQISLLCMQEHATDQPTMSEVVFMLGNETILPSPKKPAFILQSSNPNSSSARQGPYSVNDVTITMLQAR